MSTQHTEPSEAPRWAVTFATKDDMSHPVWYGKKDGPPIKRERIMEAAREYLAENAEWLKAIEYADPVDY